MLPLLIFDYDGVIHNNLCVYEPAFRKTHEEMIRTGIIGPETVSSEDLSGWFGMTAKDMWLDFHPELPEEVRDKAAYDIGMNLVRLVAEHQARWYDGAKEMLDSLKSMGFQMVILSNSRHVTGEVHWKEFGLGTWFRKWYDSESYGWEPKSEIIKAVLNDNCSHKIPDSERRSPGSGNSDGCGRPGCIMIGDRYADFDAAKAVNAPFIGCLYGFSRPGELDDAPYKASKPGDIAEIVKSISECADTV